MSHYFVGWSSYLLRGERVLLLLITHGHNTSTNRERKRERERERKERETLHKQQCLIFSHLLTQSGACTHTFHSCGIFSILVGILILFETVQSCQTELVPHRLISKLVTVRTFKLFFEDLINDWCS